MTLTPPPSKRPRVFYVDVIRSWASLLVVASHIFANVCAGMNQYSLSIWWVFNIFDSIMRPCAALFVMISGKLILSSPREESYVKAVWRRCYKLLPPFFVWSMIYAVYNAHLEDKPFVLGQALSQFVQGPTEYHLWFMYVIVGLYIVAPFLRRFVQSATPSEIIAILVIWFGFLTIQFLYPEWEGAGSGVILINYGGYFILGYVLDQLTIPRRILGPAVAAVILILINAFATYHLTAANHGTLDEKFYGGATPLVALYSAALFLIMKNVDYDRLIGDQSWLRRFIIYFSKESYNVYLIHALFIWLFMKGELGFELSLDSGPGPLFGVPATTAAVLALSLTFCWVVRKIPVVSRLFIISSSS